MTVVYNKEVRFARVVNYQYPFVSKKWHPKTKVYVEETEETYEAKIDENDIYSYVLPESDIMNNKLANGSKRYRLYGRDQKPLDVRKRNANGSMSWETHYPWEYEVKMVPGDEIDPENGERIPVKKIFWKEITPKVLADIERKEAVQAAIDKAEEKRSRDAVILNREKRGLQDDEVQRQKYGIGEVKKKLN